MKNGGDYPALAKGNHPFSFQYLRNGSPEKIKRLDSVGREAVGGVC